MQSTILQQTMTAAASPSPVRVRTPLLPLSASPASSLSSPPPEWVSACRVALSRVVSFPPLKDKLLARPPFAYVFDCLVSVHRCSHVFNGANIAPEEWTIDAVQTKDARVSLLSRIIHHISSLSGQPLHSSISPLAIVELREPDRTCELLRVTAELAAERMRTEVLNTPIKLTGASGRQWMTPASATPGVHSKSYSMMNSSSRLISASPNHSQRTHRISASVAPRQLFSSPHSVAFTPDVSLAPLPPPDLSSQPAFPTPPHKHQQLQAQTGVLEDQPATSDLADKDGNDEHHEEEPQQAQPTKDERQQSLSNAIDEKTTNDDQKQRSKWEGDVSHPQTDDFRHELQAPHWQPDHDEQFKHNGETAPQTETDRDDETARHLVSDADRQLGRSLSPASDEHEQEQPQSDDADFITESEERLPPVSEESDSPLVHGQPHDQHEWEDEHATQADAGAEAGASHGILHDETDPPAEPVPDQEDPTTSQPSSPSSATSSSPSLSDAWSDDDHSVDPSTQSTTFGFLRLFLPPSSLPSPHDPLLAAPTFELFHTFLHSVAHHTGFLEHVIMPVRGSRRKSLRMYETVETRLQLLQDVIRYVDLATHQPLPFTHTQLLVQPPSMLHSHHAHHLMQLIAQLSLDEAVQDQLPQLLDRFNRGESLQHDDRRGD